MSLRSIDIPDSNLEAKNAVKVHLLRDRISPGRRPGHRRFQSAQAVHELPLLDRTAEWRRGSLVVSGRNTGGDHVRIAHQNHRMDCVGHQSR